MPHNKYSRIVTQDSTQPAAQAMLHAIGLTEEDFKKPFIGLNGFKKRSGKSFIGYRAKFP